jgi:5'-nucleotidase
MFDAPIDLKRARILLSNDDGVHAPGLRALERVARTISKDVWVVAPETEQSGASHSLTLHRPLRVRKLGPRKFAVDGTPTDSVLLAINHILADKKPDLVLSGFNRGGNLGEDISYSGTVAAAMEATILGVPAVALSLLAEDEESARWKTAAIHLPGVLKGLASVGWPSTVFINVNFPDIPANKVTGIRVTRLGRRKLGDELVERKDPRGRSYFWIGVMRMEEEAKPGTDLAAVIEGAISVTPAYLSLTPGPMLQRLKKVFP